MSVDGYDAMRDLGLEPLLGAVETYLRRYMVMSDHQLAAVTLWVAHTYPIEDLWTTPYLHITSGEYGSGKSRLLLDVLGSLVRAPLAAVDITPADLYRSFDALRPTALIDEVDALFGEKRQSDKAEAIRAALNAGYRRRGAEVRRWDVTSRDSVVFNVFCPKALAGVGDLPRSLATRSIRIRLKKRLESEDVSDWSDIEDASHVEAEPMRSQLAELAPQLAEAVRGGRPSMPPGVRDRDADIWAPLLAIADAAGGDWPERARLAAVALLSDAVDSDDRWGIRLLRDVATVVDEAKKAEAVTDHITTKALLDALHGIPDSPWADWYGGRPLSAERLAKLLRPYDCRPGDVWTPDGSRKGYKVSDLQEAFDRYLRRPTREAREARENTDGHTDSEPRGSENPRGSTREARGSSRVGESPETGMNTAPSRPSRVEPQNTPTSEDFQRLMDVLVVRVANHQLTEADAEAIWLEAEPLDADTLELVVADLENGDGPWGTA